MTPERTRLNQEYLDSRRKRYAFERIVGVSPMVKPEQVKPHVSHFARIPIGGFVVWLFETERDLDAFGTVYRRIAGL